MLRRGVQSSAGIKIDSKEHHGRHSRFGRNRLPGGLTAVVVVGLLAYFAFIYVLPIAQAFWYSVNIYDLQSSHTQFVGLRNFERLVGDEHFWAGLRITAVFTLLDIGIGLPLALGLAAILTSMRGARRSVPLALIFLPTVMPDMAVILIWQSMLQPQQGLLDMAFSTVGLGPMGWLSSAGLALGVIVTMTVWKYLGFNVVFWITGLTQLPVEVYEAAALDGAGKLRQFFSISLPLLRPLLVYWVVVAVIQLAQFLGPFLAITQGDSGAQIRSQTQPLILYLYNEGFRRLNISYAAAMTVVLFVILVTLSWLQLRAWRSHLVAK